MSSAGGPRRAEGGPFFLAGTWTATFSGSATSGRLDDGDGDGAALPAVDLCGAPVGAVAPLAAVLLAVVGPGSSCCTDG